MNIKKSEKGVYLVTVAILSVIFIGLCALVIGLGMVLAGHAKLQNTANLVSLSALEKFANEHSQNYSAQTAAALGRANEIFAANPLAGTANELSGIVLSGDEETTNAGGALAFGRWFPWDPDGQDVGDNPCNDNYPCFVENQENPDQTNAVRASVYNQSSNPLTSPFTHLFGKDSWILTGQATASMVQRCVALVVDISGSSATETHLPHKAWEDNSTPPPKYIPVPNNNPSLFVFRDEVVTGLNCIDDINGVERFYWCNMDETRDVVSADPTKHYRSDYQQANALYGDDDGHILADKFFESYDTYFGPQPLSRYFLAFNAAIREIQKVTASGDSAMLMGFTAKVLNRRYPVVEDEATDPRLTSNFDNLLKITNMNNMGRIDLDGNTITGKELRSPNFLQYGLYPLVNDMHTNLVRAIYEAATSLSGHCPDTAKKVIILATDGMGACTESDLSDISDDVDPDCNLDLDHYNASETQLLNQVVPFLQARKIALTAIIDGAAVQPHILNIKSPSAPVSCENDDPDCYLSYEEAMALGYGSNSVVDGEDHLYEPDLVEIDNSVNPPAYTQVDISQENFERIGEADVAFHRPIAALASATMLTGGIMCPLLQRGGDENDYVDHDSDPDTPKILRNNKRIEYNPSNHNVQTIATEYATKAEQAAMCAAKAVGNNPYILVE